MPEGESIYDVYRGAGKATGEYQASLYGIEDVWSGIESAREKAKWKSEQTERTIDTISAGLELASQAYGGYQAKKEFEGYLGDVEEIRGPYEKVGAEGKAWGKMSLWEKMWQTPKYKFGEEILGREDITVMARMAKYGIDISPGGASTISTTITKSSTAPDPSMLQEVEKGDDPVAVSKAAQLAAEKLDAEKAAAEDDEKAERLKEAEKSRIEISKEITGEKEALPKVEGPSAKYKATVAVATMNKDQLVDAIRYNKDPLVKEAARMRLQQMNQGVKPQPKG